MPAFRLNDLPKEKRIQMIGEFYDMVDSLQDRNEVRLFIKSLLSADEISTLMRRIEIAVLLSGKFTYDQIINILGTSVAKISSVQKAFNQDDSGYKFIIKRLIENRKKRLKRIKKLKKDVINMSPFAAIKKYSSARVLPELLDAVIEKLEDDKNLEKEALLFTPSRASFNNKK